MLRQIYMNKYKEKSKFDDERFIKEDDEYLLKEMRPVKDTSIKRLPKKKLDKFIDDILTNIKFTKILYASNSQDEIKKYYKTKQSLEKNEKKKKKKKKKKNKTN
jgi:hypothetical protein